MTRRGGATLLLASVSCLALPLAAHAGDTEITPFASVTQSVTDNAFSSVTNATSDTFTTLDAGVRIDSDGRRANGQLDYTFSYDRFKRHSELNGMRQNLLGTGEVETWEDWVFFTGKAAITQENLASPGAVSASERTVDRDQTQVVNYGFGPKVDHDFGRWASLDASYEFGGVMFSDTSSGENSAEPSDTISNKFDLSLTGGQVFKKFGWKVTGKHHETTAEGNATNPEDTTTTNMNAELELDYAITRQIAAVAKYGYDRRDDDDADDALDGGYYSIGARVTSGDRLAAELTYGKRFDGSVIDANVSYDITKRTVFTLRQSTTVETQQERIASGQILDADGNLVNPNETGTEFIEATTKTTALDARLTHSRRRTDYTFTMGFREQDFFDEKVDSNLNLGFDMIHQVRRDMTGNVRANYTTTLDTQEANSSTQNFNLNLGLTYNLNSTLAGTLNYNFLDQQADSGQNVRENVVSVGLQKSF